MSERRNYGDWVRWFLIVVAVGVGVNVYGWGLHKLIQTGSSPSYNLECETYANLREVQSGLLERGFKHGAFLGLSGSSAGGREDGSQYGYFRIDADYVSDFVVCYYDWPPPVGPVMRLSEDGGWDIEEPKAWCGKGCKSISEDVDAYGRVLRRVTDDYNEDRTITRTIEERGEGGEMTATVELLTPVSEGSTRYVRPDGTLVIDLIRFRTREK